MTGQLINAEIIRILSPKSYTQSGMRAHHKDDKELSSESFGPLTDYTRKHDNSAFTQSPCSWRNACSGTEAFSTGRDDAPYVYLRGAPAVLSAARKCLQAAKKHRERTLAASHFFLRCMAGSRSSRELAQGLLSRCQDALKQLSLHVALQGYS